MTIAELEAQNARHEAMLEALQRIMIALANATPSGQAVTVNLKDLCAGLGTIIHEHLEQEHNA